MFGQLPERFKHDTVELGKIADMLSGGTPSSKHPEYYGDKYPFVTTPCLGKNYIDESDAVNWLSEAGVQNSSTHIIPAYSVMYGSRVGVGKCSINICEMCTNQDILSFFNIDTSKYDLLFIKKVMDQYFDYVDTQKRGSTIKGVPSDIVKSIRIPKVPIEEQRAFAEFTQQSDKSKFIGFKSQFIEMFGDEAKQVRLDELCLHFGDGDWIESKDQSEEGIRLIQTGNVGNGEYKDKDDKARYISEETFARLGCTEVFPGDILISRLPDPIGRACIVPEMPKSITAVDCTIVRLKDEILSTFFVNFTKTPMYNMQIDSFTTGSTRKRISRANLGSIMVPVPDLARQERFVLIAEQSDKSKLKEDFYENRIDTFIKRNTSWLWCWERRN